MTLFLQQMFNAFANAGVYLLISVGITLIFGLTGIVNFAHGEMLMLGAFFCVSMVLSSGIPLYAAIAIAVLALGVVGLVLERGLFRWTFGTPISGFIVSLGLIVVLQNIAVVVWGANQVSLTNPLTAVWSIGGVRVWSGQVVVIGVALATLVLGYLFVNRSRVGRGLRACGEDLQAAQLLGIPVRRYVAGVFVAGSALAGLGGGLLASLGPVTPFIGHDYIVKAFAVALIGGLGSVFGAAAASLLLAVVETLTAGYQWPQWTDAYAFALMLVVLLFRQQGLFGGAGGSKV